MRVAIGFLIAGAFVVSLVAASAAPSSPAGVAPEAVSRADERAIRAVVQGQLDAFAADDAEAAFAFATPAIRKHFGNAAHFMDAVRTGYPVVYRPARVVFLRPEVDSGGAVQGVRMTDGQGTAWRATYRMQRQPNRGWRIDGCVVVPDRGGISA